MTDEEKIIQLYKEMYTAMICKDKAELERVHDDSFILIHMTGMRQPKSVYISSILDGTLNYSASHENLLIANAKQDIRKLLDEIKRLRSAKV